MTGLPVGAVPAGTTVTWKDDPESGAGVHWKAHPMFQPAAVTVKAGLVQFPWDCVGPSRRCAGVAAAEGVVVVLLVVPPGLEVVVVDFFRPVAVVAVVVGAVLAVAPLAAVVVGEPLGVGSL
jgi:hypothetical protein